jgi:hypothetical protein
VAQCRMVTTQALLWVLLGTAQVVESTRLVNLDSSDHNIRLTNLNLAEDNKIKDPAFPTSTSFSQWPVDSGQFSVVEAVPEINIPRVEMFTAQVTAATGDVFSHVPAVTAVETVRYMEHEYTIEEEDLTPAATKKEDKPFLMQGRRVFRRCHGKCVQKACLPVGELSVYSDCVEKCRNSCNTRVST